jgi:thioesterase domain-containing protein
MMTVEMLTPIWERVLQRTPVLPHDDFFDLGGNFLTAFSLIDEIRKSIGARLPITIFPAVLSVARMAAMFDSAETSTSPLVLVRAGADDRPAVFLAHGMGGSALETFPIGRRIRWPGAIYAIQGSGLDALGPPHAKIEDMAQFAVDAMVDHQPHGPYHLAGISSGGMVMLEAALRLMKRGEQVALLAFLDTYPHPRLWPTKCWVDDISRRIKRHIKILTEQRPREATSHLALLPAKILKQLRYRAGEPLRLAENIDDYLPPGLNQLRIAYTVAVAGYRPRPFAGTVNFLKADLHPGFPTNPALVWSRFCQRLEVHMIHSEHVEMITTHAGETADCLSRCLDRA